MEEIILNVSIRLYNNIFYVDLIFIEKLKD